MVPLSSDMGAFVSSGQHPIVEVDLSLHIQLEITRTKTDKGEYYLGIMVTASNGLSERTTGVMGEFHAS